MSTQKKSSRNVVKVLKQRVNFRQNFYIISIALTEMIHLFAAPLKTQTFSKEAKIFSLLTKFSHYRVILVFFLDNRKRSWYNTYNVLLEWP